MDEDTSPYNVHELASARAALSREVQRDTFRFLHRRMTAYVKTNSKFGQNLWEGPEGRMEHIESGFPMPAKMEEESNTVSATSRLSPEGNTAEKAMVKGETLLPRQGKGSCSPSHTEIAQKNHLKSSPSCSHSPQIKSEEDLDKTSVNSHLDNSELSSKSSDFEPVCVKHSNDGHQDNTNLDFTTASKAEQKHWTKLSNIQRKTQSAQKDLEAIRPLLKNSDHLKASKEMETLHWTIKGLITSLTEEKKCIDINNFKVINNQKPSESKKLNLVKTCPQSYTETWLSLKHLCSKYKNMWRMNESVLSQFSSLEISKLKLQKQLKKIAVDHSEITSRI